MLVVPDELTLRKGAVAPWAQVDLALLPQTLDALGKHYKFRVDTPWKTCRKKRRRDPLWFGRRADPLLLR